MSTSNTTFDGSGLANKSWFDICEEELSRNDVNSSIISEKDTSVSYESKLNCNGNNSELINHVNVNDNCEIANNASEEWIRNVKIEDNLHNENDKPHHVFEDEDAKMGFKQNSEKYTSCSGSKVSPKSFASYANVLKSPPETREIKIDKLSSELVNNSDLDSRKSVKREIQKDFLQEELSLTSHLDVFHMQSPCKTFADSDMNQESALWSRRVKVDDFPKIDEWSKSGSSSKNRSSVFDKNPDNSKVNEDCSKDARGGKRRFPLALVSDSGLSSHQRSDDIPDEVLMPSPSKMIRGFGCSNSENSLVEHDAVPFARKRQREGYSSPSNRQRDNFSSPLNRRSDTFSSPSNRRKDNFSSPSSRKGDSSLLNSSEKKRDSFSSPSNRHQSEVELETDAAVLARRQKQISYGKNTVGYERYSAEVPRNMREKNHPKTPPKHIKYSRRAWDGLVKVWRRRLHYWDPPSEGGGNPELLEGDDMDLSSCDDSSQYSSSVPTTPQQDCKRRKAKNSESSNSDHEIIDYFDNGTGCLPLANDFDDYDDD